MGSNNFWERPPTCERDGASAALSDKGVALADDQARRIVLNIAKYRHTGAAGQRLSRHRGRGGINNKIHTPSAAAIMPANATSNRGDQNILSIFLNLRVTDTRRYYDLWTSRGAQFITEPKVHTNRAAVLHARPGRIPNRSRTNEYDGRPSAAGWSAGSAAGA
jgi:hypothetical protein